MFKRVQGSSLKKSSTCLHRTRFIAHRTAENGSIGRSTPTAGCARAQAKNNKKLYDQMRERGYDDEEFPSWWYSPAISSTMTQEQLPSSASKTQDQLPSASMTQDQLPSDATRTEPLTPVPPRKPLPIEGVPDRPPLSGLVSSDGVSSQTIESHRRSHRKRSICSHRRTSIVHRTAVNGSIGRSIPTAG